MNNLQFYSCARSQHAHAIRINWLNIITMYTLQPAICGRYVGNMWAICGQYVGESRRSVHDRLSEHLRYAKNPTNKSYREEAFAQHYRDYHPNLPPKLRFKIIETEPNVVRRKILEAYYINLIEPELNNKDECLDLKRFLI